MKLLSGYGLKAALEDLQAAGAVEYPDDDEDWGLVGLVGPVGPVGPVGEPPIAETRSKPRAPDRNRTCNQRFTKPLLYL